MGAASTKFLKSQTADLSRTPSAGQNQNLFVDDIFEQARRAPLFITRSAISLISGTGLTG
jgi:hypothetical protein